MTGGIDRTRFGRVGAERLPGAAGEALGAIGDALAGLPEGQAGVRIRGIAPLTPLLAADGPVGRRAAGLLGAAARPVRAILFDKSEAANWSLAWHQDRTIAVRERRAVAGFGPWTVKQGLLHVAPPFALLEAMVTLRVHLDPAGEGNAPLLVAPGSHRLGRIPEPEIDAMVARCGTLACVAEAGDIWAYATPILHASAASAAPQRRRVLQVDYAAAPLPGGLEWLGI